MNKKKRKKNNLSRAEMNSGAFKVLQNENDSLKKTLISTQNELERYRSQYHKSDKRNGVYESMGQTIVFHEIIKFFATGVLGGLSINLLTEGKYLYAAVLLFVAVLIYIFVVRIDNRIFDKKTK